MSHLFESHLAIIAGLFLALAAISHMLQQRRTPSSTVSWLLIMVLLPYVGIPLYILFGGRKMARIARMKKTVRLNQSHVLPLPLALPIDRGLRAHGIPAAMLSNKMGLCGSGTEAYNCLLHLIDEASESLYISTYVFADDRLGREILQRLTDKASQGVRVRLLLDGVGSLKTRAPFFAPLAKAGGRFSYFMPVLHHPLRGRTNLRNHRKIALADERLLMAGGTNIAEEYLCQNSSTKMWQDLSFVVEGPVVRSFVELFLSDWYFASKETLSLKKNNDSCPVDPSHQAVLQVVPSGPDLHHDGLYEAILSAVYAAQKKLWIVTPYFVPDEALTQGLAIACRRGVDVRIVVPQKSNHALADVVRGRSLREIEEAGGHIMLNTEEMMHAKLMVMDDKMAMIGSANMDLRSLFLNYEVAVLAYSENEIKAIEMWVERLSRATVSGYPRPDMARKLYEGVAQIVAPLV